MSIVQPVCRVFIAFFIIQSAATIAGTPQKSPLRKEKLLLVGGGDYPAEGLKTFMGWAGGAQTRLLVIPWASERKSEEILKEFEYDFTGYPHKSISLAPMLSDMAAKNKEFLDELANSTAVFFAGGDQNTVMDFLDKNPAVGAALHAAYHGGKPFAGTSAGTAIMSKTMLTGDGDLTVIDPTKVAVRPGLGFLTQVVVDQHFVKRQRLNRLLSVIAGAKEKFALGVDEGASVAIEGQCHATVQGNLPVIFLQKTSRANAYTLVVEQPRTSFDIGCNELH